jgi:hypothetical protein
MKEIKFLFTFFKNNQFNIHIDLFMSSKEFMDHFNNSNVDFKEILLSGNLELLRKYLCDNCSSTRSIWHSSESLNSIGEFLFQMEKEGYISTCSIQIPVLIEKEEEISEGIVYNIYMDGGISSYFWFDITNGLPLDCAVYTTQLCPKERITKKKLMNMISKLSLNDKNILERKDNFGYKMISMDMKRDGRYVKYIVTDYKKIYHSKTIRDLILTGSVDGNKSIAINYITTAYDNNDKLEFVINLKYTNGLDGEKYIMSYIISGSNSIDDNIKDCDLSIVKKVWNNEITVNKGEVGKVVYKESTIYEKKVSYKEFIKSIKEVSLI